MLTQLPHPYLHLQSFCRLCSAVYTVLTGQLRWCFLSSCTLTHAWWSTCFLPANSFTYWLVYSSAQTSQWSPCLRERTSVLLISPQMPEADRVWLEREVHPIEVGDRSLLEWSLAVCQGTQQQEAGSGVRQLRAKPGTSLPEASLLGHMPALPHSSVVKYSWFHLPLCCQSLPWL